MSAQNIIKIYDITASAGDVINVELEIMNEDEFVGFNLDIPIPEGFTYVEESAQLHRDNGHFLAFAIIENNVARMLSAAIPTTPFPGNDGVIVSFELQTPASPGTFILDIVDAIVVDANVTNLMTVQVPGTLTIESMPNNLVLQNIFVFDGSEDCHSALDGIITAGDNTDFIVYNGGSTTLIAGESIQMLPGTTVKHGGHLLARIAAHEDDYCGIPKAVEIAKEPVTSKEDVVSSDFSYEVRENGFFKLYPNPTTGEFTVELTNLEFFDAPITIEVIGMRGETLKRITDINEHQQQLNISEYHPGLYLVRVQCGNVFGIERIIKK